MPQHDFCRYSPIHLWYPCSILYVHPVCSWCKLPLTRLDVLPADMVHPIPDAVSFEDGAMMEPLSVGVHSVANLGEFKSDQVRPTPMIVRMNQGYVADFKLRSVSSLEPDPSDSCVWPSPRPLVLDELSLSISSRND